MTDRTIIRQHTWNGRTYALVEDWRRHCRSCCFHRGCCKGDAYFRFWCFGVGSWIELPGFYPTGANVYRIAYEQTHKPFKFQPPPGGKDGE